MGLGKMLGGLFGGKSQSPAAESEPIDYNGYTIVAAPLREGSQYKTAGSISRDVNGELRTARFIRADNHADHGSAVTHAQNKAKQIIEEQGDSMFERDHV